MNKLVICLLLGACTESVIHETLLDRLPPVPNIPTLESPQWIPGTSDRVSISLKEYLAVYHYMHDVDVWIGAAATEAANCLK